MHSETELASMRDRLTDLLSREKGLSVRFAAYELYEGAFKEGGLFHIVKFDRPGMHPAFAGSERYQILVFREHGAVPGSPLRELLTLAHEAGHYVSHINGEAPRDYEGLLKRCKDDLPSVTEDERHSIYDEEVRAWDYAVPWLKAVGFGDDQSLKAERERCLRTYEEGLKLNLE